MKVEPKSIESLSPADKRALLAELLQKRRAESKDYPLSFSQEAIWFFEQLQPNSSLYNLSTGVRVTERLDLSRVQLVANEIIKRHEVIRAGFFLVDGKPVQKIASTVSLPIPCVDLSQYQSSEQEAKLRKLVSEDIQRPFALDRAPLLRITVFRLENQDALLVTMHHLICDGWSLRIFIREALTLYEAYTNGRQSPLAPLPIRYSDFVVWQRQFMQGEILDRHLAYWQKQLANLSVLELPTDRARPPIQSFRGGVEHFILPESTSDQLRSLSRQQGVTLFMTLLAVFQTLLYHYTGQEDVAVGSATAGRKKAEFENLIGIFANALVLRTDMTGNPTFRELLQRVRSVCEAAYDHDDLPFEKLVEALRPKRDARWTPLFRVFFNLIPSFPRPQNSSFILTPLEGENGATGLDLSLSIMDRGHLEAYLRYSTDLFDAATVRRMMSNFGELAQSIVVDPDARLLALRCLADEKKKLAEKRSAVDRRDAGKPQEVDGLGDLTGDQVVIWTGQKMQPGVPLYNLAGLCIVWGKIDPTHFQRAFQALINSSDVMRTVIEEKDGLPRRTVLPEYHYTMEFLDFSLAADPDHDARAWARNRCQVSFNMANRLFDSVLIKLANDKFAFYFCQHHIVTDGWSSFLILDAVAELYKRSVEGRLNEAIELQPYRNYLDYEAQHRRGPKFSKIQSYWESKLHDDIDGIAFYGRPTLLQTTEVHRLALKLPPERIQKLKAIAAQQRIASRSMDGSLFNIFAAILCTYLYRISGKRRIALGVPFHNRRSKLFKETIGLFFEVLPVHIMIDENDNFLTLLQKVNSDVLNTLRHSPYALNNSWQKKMYDVVLNYHNMSRRSFNEFPIDVEAVHTGHGFDALGLRILDFNDSGNLTLEFDFHRDIFGDQQIDWAVQHFLRVMDTFIEDPSQALHQVSLLSVDEERRILVGFNQTRTIRPEQATVHRLFQIQAKRTPDALAVVFEDQQLTYAELNRRANQLARYLQKVGVGPEALVGVCLNRSLEMIVGLLAILKAGGAYVPLDRHHPKERLDFIVDDARLRVILSEEKLLSSIDHPKIVCIDRDRAEIAAQGSGNVRSKAVGENLAYVIYTSGSTGRPKGVLIAHDALANHCLDIQARYHWSQHDRVLQFASTSFDTSLEEILPTLISGATLVLRGAEVWSYRELWQKIGELELTVLDLPTSYWHQIVQAAADDSQPVSIHKLRLIILGGEAVAPGTLTLWHKSPLAKVRLVNTYGPTEATISATDFEIPCDYVADTASGTIPIGRPLRNRRIHILDEFGNVTPIAVTGELHIGGVGLARGYLNRPELTREKFIADRFSTEPGARLYKTGDLARYTPDGNIEFLGRIDNQVKLRGFRIELGEVETVLAQHPAIRDAVVLAREDGSGDRRLAAYIVAAPNCTPTPDDLRGFLQRKLPEHMVPTAFVTLETLPLTANGKVDRHALPAPDQGRPELEKVYAAPRTPLEEAVTALWAEVLGLERVGVHDSFFELGGHSLQAVQVVSKMSAAMKLEVPVRLLFLHPTVADLVNTLADNLSERQYGDQPASKDFGHADTAEVINAITSGSSAGFLQIEHRPLLSLHAAGALAPVDATALGSIPDSFIAGTGLTREQIIQEFFHELPIFSGVLETFAGRIGLIMLPVFNSEIYADNKDLTRLCVDGLKMAGRIGAKTASLTGQLGCATDYGRALETATAGITDVPMITTGHATSAATVILAIKKLTLEAARDITRERVGFIGLGVLGNACLRSMLRCLPHPAEIILCDVYNNTLLEDIRREILSDFGFRGTVRVLVSRSKVSPQFYDSTLMIGTTNIPDILDIASVRPGTMIVDYSDPRGFALAAAIARFEKQKDILFTEVMLRSPQPIRATLYLPRVAAQFVNESQSKALINHNPFDIGACIFSALLSSSYDDLQPTVGLIDLDACVRNYERLNQLEFRAADLHCENYSLPEASIRQFRENFGGSRAIQQT